ncbi:hypothetical protein EJ08DRAFT_701307 [Tothia fuscella]|uniref:Uncharacterized protein n=1 Tax=Tothia fuscella TaxID=1048955 RepID=A0A9P4NIF4_9PEZI|nr:hypothetical protein EJ08DRAFT_701307 [Tothia fuscella]
MSSGLRIDQWQPEPPQLPPSVGQILTHRRHLRIAQHLDYIRDFVQHQIPPPAWTYETINQDLNDDEGSPDREQLFGKVNAVIDLYSERDRGVVRHWEIDWRAVMQEKRDEYKYEHEHEYGYDNRW